MQTVIIVLVVAALAYIVYILFFEEEKGEVKKRLTSLRKDKETAKSEAHSKQKVGEDSIYYEDSAGYLIKSLRLLARDIAEKSKNIVLQKQLLSEAGMNSDDDAVLKHISKKIIFAGALGIMSFMLFVSVGNTNIFMKIIMMLGSPVLGFRLPDMMLKSKAKKRAEEITYALPDAIDLLTVCVEAGLGLDSALSRVAREQEKSSPILASEFNRVTKDILAGISRTDAFRNLLKRNNSAELRSFTGLLIQSDKLGTSISQALKVYSDALRTKRRQRAEQLAAQAGVKMSIPLVLFILPATFVIILGPAAMSIMQTFTNNPLTP